MTPQQLTDALNNLDDDLIAEVDRMRSTSGHRKSQWVRWLGVAACLSVVLLSLLIYQKVPPSHDGTTAQPTETISGLTNDTLAGGVIDGDSGAVSNSITATVLQWEENGFAASIVTVDHPLLKAGQKVQIVLERDASIHPEAFPTNSTVTIFVSDVTEDPENHSLMVYAKEIIPMNKEEN